MEKIRLAGIEYDSVTDGPGIRLVIFAQGCSLRCPGCHNPGTWDFNGGKVITFKEIIDILNAYSYVDGVTFSGGDPFYQAQNFAKLGKIIKDTGKDIVTYSGHLFEDIIKESKDNPGWRQLLEVSDILIDGPFLEEKQDISLPFRGSSNQRLIDVPSSIELKRVVLWDELR